MIEKGESMRSVRKEAWESVRRMRKEDPLPNPNFSQSQTTPPPLWRSSSPVKLEAASKPSLCGSWSTWHCKPLQEPWAAGSGPGRTPLQLQVGKIKGKTTSEHLSPGPVVEGEKCLPKLPLSNIHSNFEKRLKFLNILNYLKNPELRHMSVIQLAGGSWVPGQPRLYDDDTLPHNRQKWTCDSSACWSYKHVPSSQYFFLF